MRNLGVSRNNPGSIPNGARVDPGLTAERSPDENNGLRRPHQLPRPHGSRRSHGLRRSQERRLRSHELERSHGRRRSRSRERRRSGGLQRWRATERGQSTRGPAAMPRSGNTGKHHELFESGRTHHTGPDSGPMTSPLGRLPAGSRCSCVSSRVMQVSVDGGGVGGMDPKPGGVGLAKLGFE